MFPSDISKTNKEYANTYSALIFYNNYTETSCPEDIKDVSKQIDYLIADYDFFKDKNKKKLDIFTKMFKYLNRIAMETKSQIYADIDPLGDIVHFNLFSINACVDEELLTLLAYAITKSDNIHYSSCGIDFFFSFE